MPTTQNEVGAIGYTLSAATFPPGSVVDHIAVTVTGTVAGNTTPISQKVPPGTASVTFANLTPDTYTFAIQAFPAAGSGYGTPVTKDVSGASTFTVTALIVTVSLSLPSSVTWNQP